MNDENLFNIINIKNVQSHLLQLKFLVTLMHQIKFYDHVPSIFLPYDDFSSISSCWPKCLSIKAVGVMP